MVLRRRQHEMVVTNLGTNLAAARAGESGFVGEVDEDLPTKRPRVWRAVRDAVRLLADAAFSSVGKF